MTVNELIEILKPLDGDTPIVFKPEGSNYVDAIRKPGTITCYRMEKMDIISSWGCNFSAYVLKGEQIGSIDR